MGISIHFNAHDLRNVRRFGHNALALVDTLRNLSSGVRVHAGEVDGATLRINSRFSNEIQSAKAELRNISSNISLLQTLEDALVNTTGKLQKMRELAVSAGSTHLSLSDREEIEKQFRGLIDQIYTLAQDTQYNGRSYLNGDRYDLNLSLVSDSTQIKSIQDELNLFKLPNLDPKQLGKHVSHVGQGRGVFLSPLGANEIEINGVKIRNTVEADDSLSYKYRSGSAIAKAKAINASTAQTGVSAKVDMNVYRAFDSLKGSQLDDTRWIRINGHVISDLTFEDQDATHTLRKAINAGFDESGVIARLDDRGQLLLVAPDGRNLSIEFSDVDLRNALGIRDLYGDDVNFSPDVDPARYTRYGDISSVEYVPRGHHTFDTPLGQFNGTFEIIDSKFTKAQDGVDYLFEVVKAGELGQALFRVKEEQLPERTRDLDPEDYHFNAPGEELTPPTPKKVRIEESQYYGGSRVRIGLEVLKPGSPESTQVDEHPEVRVFLTSLDDPTVPETTLGTFTVSNHDPLDLTPFGLSAQLSFPVDDTRSFLDSDEQIFNLNSSISPSTLPEGFDYPLQPQVVSCY